MLRIALEVTIVETRVKILKHHVWVLWFLFMLIFACIKELQCLHTIVLESMFNCLLVLCRYDRIICAAYDKDCIVYEVRNWINITSCCKSVNFLNSSFSYLF